MKKTILAMSVVSALVMSSPLAFANHTKDHKDGKTCEHCGKEKCDKCGKDHKHCTCDHDKKGEHHHEDDAAKPDEAKK